MAKLSAADQALGQLAGVGRMLPNPHLLIRPFLQREAVLSSRIEGTIARLQELLLFEMNPSEKSDTPDVREVYNYAGALEYGIERLQTLPVSLRLIREIHERLLRGVRGATAGLASFDSARILSPAQDSQRNKPGSSHRP